MREKIREILGKILFVGYALLMFGTLPYIIIKDFFFPAPPKKPAPLMTCEQCVEKWYNICETLKQNELRAIDYLKSDNPRLYDLEKLSITTNAEIDFIYCTDRIDLLCKEECKNEDNKENNKQN